MLKLQGLNYEIKYVRGVDNIVADLLSRDVQRVEASDASTKQIVSNTITVDSIDWSAAQQADRETKRVIESINRGLNKLNNSSYSRLYNRFRIDDGILKLGDRIIVPEEQRKAILTGQHEFFGHEQTDALFRRLREKYYWPVMYDTIKKLVTTCDVCQRTKHRLTDVAELKHIVDLDKVAPLSFWSVDLQGPYHTTRRGNRYLIVAVDYITKMVEIGCLKDATAISTGRFLVNNIILRYGVPTGMKILSDQGSNFESLLIKELCDLYGISKFKSSPYHPAGNGAVERENRAIKELLRSYTLESQSDWDEYIPQIMYSRNTTVHSATGFTPYEMVYGHKPAAISDNAPEQLTSEFVKKLRENKLMIERAAVEKIKGQVE